MNIRELTKEEFEKPTEINPGTLAVRYADYNYPTL